MRRLRGVRGFTHLLPIIAILCPGSPVFPPVSGRGNAKLGSASWDNTHRGTIVPLVVGPDSAARAQGLIFVVQPSVAV
jgi:hypothetical protein